MEGKHCKWYNDEFCTNGDSPCVADYCPVVEYPELCKHREVDKDINVRSKAEEKILTDEELKQAFFILRHGSSEGLSEYIKAVLAIESKYDRQKAEIERLTRELDKQKNFATAWEESWKIANEQNTKIRVKLKKENAELQKQVDELKAKIEQGTLIELPCKVGDTVYCVYLSKKLFDISEAEEEYFIKEDVVSGYYFDGKDVLVKMVMMPIMHDLRYILKGSFQTREEAEKRLKELQE